MKTQHLLLVTLLNFSFFYVPSLAPSAMARENLPTSEITRDLERTLDLWRNGRYGELYERVAESGSHTKEYFVAHLAAAPRTPTCCWDKLQEVTVTSRDERRAKLHGKFGFDTGSGVEFMTRGVTLKKEDGIWKMKMSDLLALSGKGKKSRGGKKGGNHAGG